MKNKIKLICFIASSLLIILVGCNSSNKNSKMTVTSKTELTITKKTKGQALTETLAKTAWQGTKVYDAHKNDLTNENTGFIGLAKYDSKTGRYEFFDLNTGESRGDQGTFFVTNDGAKRVLISATKGYQAVVELTELKNEKFTYKRMGKDKEGKEVEVFVEHIPYKEKELSFTEEAPTLSTTTGFIDMDKQGDAILGETLWYGTKVVDKDGKDITEFNNNYISLAKFDGSTNKYEFFQLESGVTRGDFGYFAVINQNKSRAHASIGENKYGAVLELTELNDKKFTYKRLGKDASGNEVETYVEHEPYTGEFQPTFSF